MDHILTADDKYIPDHTAPLPAGERAVFLHGNFDDVAAMLHASSLPTSQHITAHAEVNHGSWIVRCPCTDPVTRQRCQSSQYAHFSDPRFFCISCHNHDAGGRFIQVNWPVPQLREIIEQELLRRPHPTVMNWLPGETVAQLIHERQLHVIEVG